MRRLAVGAVLLLTVGCAGDGRVESRLDHYSLQNPKTLMVSLPDCRVDATVDDLQETSTEVRILVLQDRPSPFGRSNCADVVLVELAKPLGTGAVINARNGVAVRSQSGG